MGIFLSHRLEKLREKQKQDILDRYLLSAFEQRPGPKGILTKDKQHITVILLQNHRGRSFISQIEADNFYT